MNAIGDQYQSFAGWVHKILTFGVSGRRFAAHVVQANTTARYNSLNVAWNLSREPVRSRNRETG